MERDLFNIRLQKLRSAVHNVRGVDSGQVKEVEDEIELLSLEIDELFEELDSQRNVRNGSSPNNFLLDILQSIPIEMVIFDRDFLYLFANRQAIADEKMRKWIIGKSDFDYCHNKGIDENIAKERWVLYKKVINSQETVTIEQKNTDDQGNDKHFLRLLSPVISKAGEVEYLIGYGIDITTSKQQEILLQEKVDELEKINLELDQFVYRSSHDLRAPLVSILGLVNLMAEEELPPNAGTYLGMVRQSVQKLDSFIQDIVEYSQNARGSVRLVEIDLKELIEESIRSLKFLKGASEVQFAVDIQGNPQFVTDRFRLETVINNLVSNSIKYHDPSKEISKVSISGIVEADVLKLCFQDNGIGIKESLLSKLFDMFFRASHRSFGSGLGLYIVKEIIEKLEGSIKVKSKEGEGTTFTVRLRNYQKEVPLN